MFLHDGQICTESWHIGRQNGIRQQPINPPKKQMPNAISQVPAPASYWTTVITCCWHLGHCIGVGFWPKYGEPIIGLRVDWI